VDDLSIDWERCGKLIHMFWKDPAGKFIEYLRSSRPFVNKIYVISHNSREYDTQFFTKVFGTAMGAVIENEWYENS